MNSWVKISIGVIVAGALIAAIIAEDKYTEKETLTKTDNAKILMFKEENLKKFVVVNSHGTFVFERATEKDAWKLKDSAKKIDMEAVKNMISSISSASIVQEVPATEKNVTGSDADKAVYGFVKPRITAELSFFDNAEVKTIKLGDDLSIGKQENNKTIAENIYASSSDKKNVILINNSMLQSLNKSLADIRTKILGDFDIKNIASFTIKLKSAEKIELSKINDNDWQVLSLNNFIADNSAVVSYLNKVKDFRVDNVTETEMLINGKDEMLGIKDPEAIIEFFDKDKKIVQEFKIAKTKENTNITMSDGAVGSVGVDKYEELVPNVQYFREKHVFVKNSLTDIKRIKISDNKVYVKEAGQWVSENKLNNSDTTKPSNVVFTPNIGSTNDKAKVTVTPIQTANVVNSDVSELVTQFESLVATNIIDKIENDKLSSYGLDKVSYKITFEYEQNKKPGFELLVGSSVGEKANTIYLKRTDVDTVYEVSSSTLTSLLSKISK